MPWNDNLLGIHLNIAAYPGSPLRVVAGPGTGKTFALMRRVARLLEQNVPPERVLAVTFTRTAANDLVEKLAALGTMDLDAKLELDDEMNATMLFVAGHDCATLCEANQPPEVQAYNLWFIATRFPRENEATHTDPTERVRYGEIIATIDKSYPGLRNAPLSEQKIVGKKMIHDAKGLT